MPQGWGGERERYEICVERRWRWFTTERLQGQRRNTDNFRGKWNGWRSHMTPGGVNSTAGQGSVGTLSLLELWFGTLPCLMFSDKTRKDKNSTWSRSYFLLFLNSGWGSAFQIWSFLPFYIITEPEVNKCPQDEQSMSCPGFLVGNQNGEARHC